MQLHLIRHGPKNNNPDAHGTGVEALLDPHRVCDIISYASQYLSRAAEMSGPMPYGTLHVESTPVNRAVATAHILQKVMVLDPRFRVPMPVFNERIGSYGQNLLNQEVINLSPAAMSVLWAEAKKKERYNHLQGENKPLYAWCEQGFDNLQAKSTTDPGISLREIACRIGSYVYTKLSASNLQDRYFAVGHSGDIEPFLYLTLEILQGRDGSSPDALTHYFPLIGALEPLQKISFYTKTNGALSLEFLWRGTLNDKLERQLERGIPAEIFQEQSRWYEKYGKSQQVLEQKIAQGK